MVRQLVRKKIGTYAHEREDCKRRGEAEES